MKTMYRLEEEHWVDDPLNSGRKEWKVVSEYFLTCMEAETKVHPNVTWRIVARTIDEKAFTIEDKTVKSFDYDLLVAYRSTVEERIVYCKVELAKREKSRANTKSEARAKTLDRQIAEYKKSIKENEEILQRLLTKSNNCDII